MAELRPLVFISGQVSQLPDGDVIASASYGDVAVGSGLYSVGNTATDLSIGLTIDPNPSGLLLTNNSLGVDGVSLNTSQRALASGDYAQTTSASALASGTEATSIASTALASGNAALTELDSLGVGVFLDVVAAAPIASGTPVGFDDSNKVQPILAYSSSQAIDLTPPNGSVVNNNIVTNLSYVSVVYDPVNDKYLYAYYDGDNSGYLTAVVVTKTSSGFTYGTPSTIGSANINVFTDGVYDASSGKVVLIFGDQSNNNYFSAVHITISGTSFTSGTVSQLASSYVNPGLSLCYHSTNSKLVAAYSSLSPSQTMYYAVFTVSGSGFSLGSNVDLSPGGRGYPHIVYNSTNNIIVLTLILINQVTNNIRAGTLSGSTITFGSPVAFGSGGALLYPRSTVAGDKVIITWIDNTLNDYALYSRVASFSGTTITLGSAVAHDVVGEPAIYPTLNYYNAGISQYVSLNVYLNNLVAQLFSLSSSTLTQTNSIYLFKTSSTLSLNSYNPTSNTLDTSQVINWRDGSTSYLASVSSGYLYSPTVNSRNNYLGIAQDTVASGDPLQVRLPGTFDSNFSNLTPGAAYYLSPQSSGVAPTASIGTSWSGAVNTTPTVPIGVALSPSVLLLSDTV
jgi:hypothetical protein